MTPKQDKFKSQMLALTAEFIEQQMELKFEMRSPGLSHVAALRTVICDMEPGMRTPSQDAVIAAAVALERGGDMNAYEVIRRAVRAMLAEREKVTPADSSAR